MKTEQELKDKCTPEFIKWMCELAEGFELNYEGSDKRSFIIKREPNYHEFYDWLWTWHSFPLLIHRAVEGINKTNIVDIPVHTQFCGSFFRNNEGMNIMKEMYVYKDYQPRSLTQAECAMLHCMLDIFKEI